MLKNILLITALAAATLTTAWAEGGNDWQLRIKKEDGGGWSATLNGTQDYGATSAQRIRGSGVRVEKTRSVGAFSKLRLEGPINVRITQSGNEAVRVSADDNVEPLIETRLEGDTLVLRLQPGAGFSTRYAPSVAIDSKSLQLLTVSGSGDVHIDRLKGESLTINQSGSGDLRLGVLELRELTVTLQGSGDVRVAGRADTQSWSLHGSGDVDARSLSGRNVKAQLNGSGDMDIGVTESLDVSLRGAGDFSYAGRPQVRQNVSGSGELSRR